MPDATSRPPPLGRISLDLVATVGGRLSEDPRERLNTPEELHDWFARHDLSIAESLTARHLEQVRALRERVHRVLATVAEGRPCAEEDVEFINEQAASGGVARLDVSEGVPTPAPVDAATATAIVARDAIAVLSLGPHRLGVCQGRHCGTVFLLEPGRTRRWCSSKTCGNAERVAAHRTKRRTKGGPTARAGKVPSSDS